MSSAAKLRFVGRGTAVAASAALVMTSFGPAAFAAWDNPPQGGGAPTQAVPATGIADTAPQTAGTQGATLVQAGENGQALNDVRLVIPNSFRMGDVIELRVLDRSATEQSNGRGNQGPATRMQFSANPTVQVSDAQAADTIVGVTSPGGSTNGPRQETESSIDNPWAASGTAPALSTVRPGVKPAFDVTLRQGNGSAFNDTIRLTVNTNPSTGDPNAKWVISLEDLQLDLGENVTPGALRVVPFAYNRDDSGRLLAAPNVFSGNVDRGAITAADGTQQALREIGVYTVPGYVSPVRFEAGTPNIVAGAGAQSIGDLTITETFGASLTNGTYTVTVDNATIANRALSEIRASVADGGTNETVTVDSVSNDGRSFTFTVANADNERRSTITFAGLMLNPTNPGRLSFTMTGGSVDIYMEDPDDSSTASISGIIPGQDVFVDQDGTEPPSTPQQTTVVGGPASGVTPGGSGTPLGAGDYTLNQIGGNFWELLNADGEQVATSTNGQVFTLVAPYSTSATLDFGAPLTAAADDETVTVTPAAAPAATAVGTSAPEASNPTSSTGSTTINATNSGAVLPAETFTIGGSVGALTATGAGGEVWTSTDGLVWTSSSDSDQQFTLVYALGVDDQFTVAAAGDLTSLTYDYVARDVTATGVTLTQLPAGTYTFVGPNSAATPSGAGTDWEFQNDAGDVLATSDDGLEYTFADDNAFGFEGSFTLDAVPGNTQTLVVAAATSVSIPGSATVTVTPSPDAAPGDYTVTRPSTMGASTLTRESDGAGSTGVTNPVGGTTWVYAFADGSTVTLSDEVVDDTSFTISLSSVQPGVNQSDIVAPRDQLVQLGTVSAGTASIGGSNRFGTAARIAHEFVRSTGQPTADAAIVVNGMSAPDALSASFLSQREGAPILLTAPGQLPSETVEALRDLGVRKVYIVGGRSAVGAQVHDALRNQDAYMWDNSAQAIKPRGDKLEVVQLGGDNRYQTNWRVNTYAAAQTADAAPVGKIATGYGQPLRTTAMLARSSTSNDFVDALSASVLSAGAAGGLRLSREATAANTFTVTVGDFGLAAGTNLDALAAGQYRLGSGNSVERLDGGSWVPVPNSTWSTSSLSIGGTSYPTVGTLDVNDSFTITANENAGAQYGYDNRVKNANALPVILTQPTQLVSEAAAQMRALHIEHMLFVGGDSALAPAVNDQVAEVGATSYRIGGADRWETAANVNRFAMSSQTVTAAGQTPGLGFDGTRVYSNQEGTNLVGGQTTAYLANGLRFPDALVAGPWVSRTRNVMVMTLQDDLPAPTATFISEQAARIDNAAGLGQGSAVSSGVIVEANRIAATR